MATALISDLSGDEALKVSHFSLVKDEWYGRVYEEKEYFKEIIYCVKTYIVWSRIAYFSFCFYYTLRNYNRAAVAAVRCI